MQHNSQYKVSLCSIILVPRDIYTKCRTRAHYAACHYDACHYAACRYAECHGTSVERPSIMKLSITTVIIMILTCISQNSLKKRQNKLERLPLPFFQS
jgi:hypothetical protein